MIIRFVLVDKLLLLCAPENCFTWSYKNILIVVVFFVCVFVCFLIVGEGVIGVGWGLTCEAHKFVYTVCFIGWYSFCNLRMLLLLISVKL